jgi:hypothetical protein
VLHPWLLRQLKSAARPVKHKSAAPWVAEALVGDCLDIGAHQAGLPTQLATVQIIACHITACGKQNSTKGQ